MSDARELALENTVARLKARVSELEDALPACYVVMPKELTAENGAKALMMGEFSETIFMACEHCDDGIIDDGVLDEICQSCGGSGDYALKVTVGWDTIKSIYAMAVKNLAHNK